MNFNLWNFQRWSSIFLFFFYHPIFGKLIPDWNVHRLFSFSRFSKVSILLAIIRNAVYSGICFCTRCEPTTWYAWACIDSATRNAWNQTCLAPNATSLLSRHSTLCWIRPIWFLFWCNSRNRNAGKSRCRVLDLSLPDFLAQFDDEYMLLFYCDRYGFKKERKYYP